jgi:AhpC/TSA family
VSEDAPPPRLDPDRAASDAASRGRHAPEPVIDTRPYRRIIGGIGIGIAIVISALLVITRGIGPVGIPPGHPLHWFVAPLATSNLVGDANLAPRCDPAHPDARALNICPWLAARAPLVIGFFIPSSGDCTREIDTIQAVSKEFKPGTVQFAAVAVRTNRSASATLVRSHHWTIPVAYDRDAAVGSIYGVQVCPLLELAYRGGRVKYRLVGDEWLASSALATKVRTLLGH